MKMKLISVIFIIFCITSTLSAACDDESMTTSTLCTANSTCQWTAASCGSTTTNSDGDDCTSQTTSTTCSGNCVFTAESEGSSTGTCAAGTTNEDEESCSEQTEEEACNGGCTWTAASCTEKTTTTTTTTSSSTTDNAFGLKNSILILLGLFLF